MAALAALSALDPATALQPSSKWHVETIDISCVLSRSFSGERGNATLMVTHGPTNLLSEVLIALAPWPGAKRGAEVSARLRIEETGEEAGMEGMINRLDAAAGSAIKMWVPHAFLRKLTADSTLTLKVGGRPLVQLKPKNASGALEAVDGCVAELLRSWGVDPTPLKNLRSGPAPTEEPYKWFTNAQFAVGPTKSESGRVLFVYMVGTDGRVRNCRTVVTALNKVLNNQGCQTIEHKARYTPAIGADGAPKEVPVTVGVHFIY